jgi:tetratricopeptide (TPR) repeat protein
MKKGIIAAGLVSLCLMGSIAGAAEITGIDREEISIKAGPTQPGEKLSMAWLEALVFPKVVKGDRIISLGVRLTSRAKKVKASFDFGEDAVALSSNNGLNWSGAYQLPAGLSSGLHVARYTIVGKRGSISRSVEFFVEKPRRAESEEVGLGEAYRAQGWPLTVVSSCSALVGTSSRVLYAGQRVIGVSKVPWYKVVFADGEMGWVAAAKVREPVKEYFHMGQKAYYKKEYASAVSYFKDLLAIDPEMVEGHNWLVKSHLKQGQVEAAYLAIKKAMAVDDRNMQSKVLANELAQKYYAIARRQSKAGKHRQAIAAYQKVVELKPTSIASWIELGKGYNRLGLKDEARSAWREALRFDANDKTVLALLEIKAGEAAPALAAAPAPVKAKVAKVAKKPMPKVVVEERPQPKKVMAMVAGDSLAIVKAKKTKRGTRIDLALKSVISLTKSLGTPVVEKGWEVKRRGERFLVRYLCEQGEGVREAFEWAVDAKSRRVSAYNDNAKLLMTRW